MAKSDIWMKLYIGDYLADTQSLTAEQHGAYLLLLMTYYRTGPLPTDTKKLRLICRVASRNWNICWSIISSFFHVGTDGLFHHKRADHEIEHSRLSSEKNKDKAEKAAAARWGNHAPSNAPSMTEEDEAAMHEAQNADAPSMVSQSQSQSYKEQVQKQQPSEAPVGARDKAPKKRKEPDPRHTEFRDAFRTYFLYKNRKLTQEPWDGQEAAHLTRFLTKNPKFTTDQWKQLLKHRAGSPVSHAESLSVWISRAFNWLDGTTDAQGRRITGGNTHAKPTIAEQVIDASQQALDILRSKQLVDGEDRPGEHPQARGAGPQPKRIGDAGGVVLEASR